MRLKLRVTAFVLAAIGLIGICTPVAAQEAPDKNSVLILGSTVEPGLSAVSLEEAKAVELGYTVVIDSDAAWVVRSASDFASFRAIILGDRTCSILGTTLPDLNAALANRSVWSPAITGNIVLVGTDPTYHSAFNGPSSTQGDVVTTTMRTIVAVHEALTGLTDKALSDWNCSVHEAFDSFPSDFLPLAIAKDIGCPSPPGAGLNFGDITCGTPYILARGEELSPVACGNGTPEAGEGCDDSNTENGDGCSASCTLENNAPSCSAAATSAPGLWPPNHQLVGVSITGVVDPDGDPITITATYVAQDEAVTGQGLGAGQTSPDASLSPLAVRAERNGNPKTPGDGRVYHISFTASDGEGGSCSGVVSVCVPHDRRPGASCIDGGALFSSIP